MLVYRPTLPKFLQEEIGKPHIFWAYHQLHDMPVWLFIYYMHDTIAFFKIQLHFANLACFSLNLEIQYGVLI
jgi:hypothetical protein